MFEKPATTTVPIAELLARRWSPRALDPQRPVTREHLLALLEAARWAPSCFGDQPWHYVIWDRFRDAGRWAQAFATLTEGNRSWAGRAPLLLLAVAATTFRHNGKPNPWGPYDTGAASLSLCLQASALGLVAHQMGGFDRAAIATVAGLPDGFLPQAMIAVGHPGALELLDATQQAKERAPRTRLPLDQIAFEAGWGTGVSA